MVNPGQKRLTLAPTSLLKKLKANTPEQESKPISTPIMEKSTQNTELRSTSSTARSTEEAFPKKKRGRPKGTTRAVMEQRRAGVSVPTPAQETMDGEYVENLTQDNTNTRVVVFNSEGSPVSTEETTPPYPSKGPLDAQAAWIDSYGPTFQGKREIIKLYKGEPISAREAIRAKCYDCMGFFQDGKGDCTSSDACSLCPLYPFYPFSTAARHLAKKKNINPTWLHKAVEEDLEEDGAE